MIEFWGFVFVKGQNGAGFDIDGRSGRQGFRHTNIDTRKQALRRHNQTHTATLLDEQRRRHTERGWRGRQKHAGQIVGR